MRVKRYVVDSMPDALDKIRLELGKDAIILNTKSVKTGGFLGFFSKQQIEVIAAIENKQERERESPKSVERPVNVPNAVAAKRAYQQPPMTDASPVQQASPSTAQAAVVNESSVAVAPPPSPPSQTPQVTESSKNEYMEMTSELRDMRDMFKKLLLMKHTNDSLPAAFISVRDRLLQQEVTEEVVTEILCGLLTTLEEPQKLTQEEVHKQASQMIKGMLEKGTQTYTRISRSVRYCFFFGPTGVGKTTTIAKLAAEAMLKEKRKVGFITSDTYRIAAIEQLKTYANILNVPLEVVFSPKEMEQAMERLSDCDLILVDTAGRNYRNDEYVKSMKEFLRYREQSENYLVLSLTTKYGDMKAIITNFKDATITKVIFTKADETEAYGAILNIVYQLELSLSYMTTGQNVPDDIEGVTSERVANLILGVDTHA